MASFSDATCTEKVFEACPTGKRPRGRPRTCSRDCVSRLDWGHFRFPLVELEKESRGREVWLFQLGPLLGRTRLYLDVPGRRTWYGISRETD